ncbi:hypothetical protein [Streptomyces sparsogenes]|uniref:Uncharacterized protein n=1 Tax=Streptomyces sparsogenes DSM 40356 TaxID=1331668 RepID=A0A1R1S6V1_9ACTN|nr:hypothetical protein [Streptomyces sparsogenes]OMI34017.1 hypothetical protein SPAR_38450 [Streptomyces sparsogenes DSM 40356]
MTLQICARCDKPTSEPVTVAVEHSASAGGRTVYACPPCAPTFPQQRDVLAELAAMHRAREQGWVR